MAATQPTKDTTTFQKSTYLSMNSSTDNTQNMSNSKNIGVTGEIGEFSFREMIVPPINVSIYTGPELYVSKSVIVGKVFNHKKYEDGKTITTSCIERINKGIIYTESGSTYILRDAEQKYEAYCRENGVKVFPDDMVL